MISPRVANERRCPGTIPLAQVVETSINSISTTKEKAGALHAPAALMTITLIEVGRVEVPPAPGELERPSLNTRAAGPENLIGSGYRDAGGSVHRSNGIAGHRHGCPAVQVYSADADLTERKSACGPASGRPASLSSLPACDGTRSRASRRLPDWVNKNDADGPKWFPQPVRFRHAGSSCAVPRFAGHLKHRKEVA